MRAVCLIAQDPGFQLQNKPSPPLGPRQVRVRVHAAGLNRADLLQLRGHYPAPPGAPPDILGLEYAGEVIERHPGATRLALGDRVMGIVGGGAFAEEVVVHEEEALGIPEGLSFTAAAAIPEAFLTAFDACVQASLQPGETVLVHAVTSGVGTAALQWAHAMKAFVIGTSRSADKLARCQKELGLEHPLLCDRDPPSFKNEVRALGAQVALELVGGRYLPETIESMSPRGRIVLIGLTGGASATLPLSTLLSRRLTLQGTVLRSRPLDEKIALAERFRREALPFFSQGLLRPIVDRVYPMHELSAAFARMSANEGFGKTVLTWES